MRRRIANAGVAVAAMASLGLGGGLVVGGAAPAGAAETAAPSATGLGGLTGSLDALVVQVDALVPDLVANLNAALCYITGPCVRVP